MKKKTWIIVGVVILSLVVVGIAKDGIIKSVVTVSASSITGAPVNIGGFSLGLLSQSVKIKGFKMYNPAGFPKGILLDLAKVRVDYDLLALLSGKLHLKIVDVDLREAVIVKNKEGKLNVDSLKVMEKKEAQAEKKKEPAKQMPFRIDLLKLNIGRVVSKDYSGAKPIVEVYDVGIKGREYKNITSPQSLAVIIMAEALGPTAIKSAAVYGVATVAGVALLPLGAGVMLTGKDNAAADFNVTLDKAYETSLEVLKATGVVDTQEKAKGLIKAKIGSNDIALKIESLKKGKVKITVSARKYLIPQLPVAAGVIYQISEKLK